MKRVVAFLPTLMVLALIAYASLWREMPSVLPHVAHADKWAHGAMYAVLGICMLVDMRKLEVKWGWTIAWSLIIPALYGGAMELLQKYFFAPRTGDWWDWAADIVGAIVGVAFVVVLQRIDVREHEKNG